jgi:aspartate aminotransferase
LSKKEYVFKANHRPDVNLNLNVRGMLASATVSINEHCNRLIAQNRQVFKLGLGQSPFPVPDPLVDELKAHAHEKDYLPVKGLPELQNAVVGYLDRRHHVTRSAEDVLVGPGSKELMFLLQLVYYGDLVVPTPCWVSYAPQANIVGHRISFLHTTKENGWQLTPGRLESLCQTDPDRPRIVILNYPNNPTGGTYHLDQLKALAEVARRYRVILLSDEIYGELHFRGQHVSVARYYPEGTIVSGGLSKWCGAGGWRLGVFVFPHSLRWLRDAMAAVASETYTATCAPIQYAAVRAYEGDLAIERYLQHSRRILRALGRWCYEQMADCGVTIVKPAGAFYLFPDFSRFANDLKKRKIATSEDLCRQLLEDTGVAMLPGSVFGRAPEELTVRIAYVNFDGCRALAAAESAPAGAPLDLNFLRSWCNGTVEAFNRLCDWFHALNNPG